MLREFTPNLFEKIIYNPSLNAQFETMNLKTQILNLAIYCKKLFKIYP